ncbi:hypothetical protein HAX54_000335 [Datura stramonium]|uniref:FBD domain-containing protein n=1 Tax=Datura stramonium TaxID=4076 RepID=A0ABS8T1M1_DATST|nr:hypothetical protein [Datura stramonium]
MRSVRGIMRLQRYRSDYWLFGLSIKFIDFHKSLSRYEFVLPLAKYLLRNATVLEKCKESDVSRDRVKMETGAPEQFLDDRYRCSAVVPCCITGISAPIVTVNTHFLHILPSR